MDVLGVRPMKGNKKNRSRRSNSKKDIKVVYISSPMKFKTCASEFRALVQELTGKDSDVDGLRFMDNDGGSTSTTTSTEYSPTSSDGTRVVDDRDFVGLPMAYSNHQALFDHPFDHDGLLSDGSFLGMFTSNLFNDASNFDAIRSFI